MPRLPTNKTRNSKLETRENKVFSWKRSSGFTLTELLIVIMIIGVLAGVMVALINPLAQFQKAHDAQRISDVKELQGALEMYRAQNGYYPIHLLGCNGPWIDNNITYLSNIPCDPSSKPYTGSNANDYLYCAVPNPNDATQAISYVLTVCTERQGSYSQDPGACSGQSYAGTNQVNGVTCPNPYYFDNP